MRLVTRPVNRTHDNRSLTIVDRQYEVSYGNDETWAKETVQVQYYGSTIDRVRKILHTSELFGKRKHYVRVRYNAKGEIVYFQEQLNNKNHPQKNYLMIIQLQYDAKGVCGYKDSNGNEWKRRWSDKMPYVNNLIEMQRVLDSPYFFPQR